MTEQEMDQTPNGEKPIQWLPVALIALCLVAMTAALVYIPEVENLKRSVVVGIGTLAVVSILTVTAALVDDESLRGNHAE